MEIKATLNKPYSEEQRLDFIVSNNHQQGYEIKETENALEAWGLTEEEKAEQAKQARKAELVAQLDAIDLKTIRPIRAIQSGNGTEEDTERLSQLETLAEEVRQQIKQLKGE